VRGGVETIEGIPVQWVALSAARGVALWLTHPGGSTEQAALMLTRLAERGMLAVRFDPPRRGPCELAREVLEAFRRRMSPLAGRTVLESLRVLDRVDEQFGVGGPRVAGGVSMGGDVAVALAGIDARIDRVAVLVATPDLDPARDADPGAGARPARPRRARPLRTVVLRRAEPRFAHLEAYGREVAIAFLALRGS
jgi:uncharacterized protein